MRFGSATWAAEAGGGEVLAAENKAEARVRGLRAINQSELFGHDRELVLARDPTTRHDVIKIVSRSDGEVIGQVPTEVVLQMAAFWQPKSK